MDYAALLKNYLAQGTALQAALELLRNDGASPIEAVDAIMQAAQVPEAQAKELFGQSRAWQRPRVSNTEPTPAEQEAAAHHGRSGHGASSVLPHLLRQPPSQGSGS